MSPSAGLPGLFGWVQDLGLERLRSVFGLVPVEYPTTRTMGASPQDRARDVMAAFADPANRAVFTSVGGDDQVTILKYLDPQVLPAGADRLGSSGPSARGRPSHPADLLICGACLSSGQEEALVPAVAWDQRLGLPAVPVVVGAVSLSTRGRDAGACRVPRRCRAS